MKERIALSKTNEGGAEKNRTIDFEELAEVIQGDFEAVRQAVLNLQEEFRNAPRTGATSRGLYRQDRREFVVPLISAEQKDRILENLTDLGIFPWEENGLLIIEHRKDVEKLRAAGFIPDEEKIQHPETPLLPTGAPVEDPTIELVDPERTASLDESAQGILDELPKRPRFDPHAFPFPPQESKKETMRRNPAEKQDGAPDEPREIDEELQKIVDAFDSGNPDITDSPEFKARLGELPTLTLFPQKYIWDKGEMYERHSGKHITKEDREALYANAKNGDAKALEEAVRMNVGLVLRAQARVWKRQGGSDLQPDDIFQEGLMGLTRAFVKWEPGRATFGTVALMYAESRMRRFIAEKRRVVHLPAHTSTIRSQYHKLKKPLEEAGIRDRRVLAAALHEKEMIWPPTEASLDKFERTYFIQSRFDPLDESFAEALPERIDLNGNPLFSESSENATLETERAELLHEAISQLPPREELILCMRFGIIPSKPIDIRALINGGFYFSLPEETLEKEPIDDLLRRARSVMEDKKLRGTSATGRTMHFVELLEQAHKADREPLTDTELEKYNGAERLFLAMLGALNQEQAEKYPLAPDCTLEEVANVYGGTKELIRGIETKALRHLKHPRFKKLINRNL